MNMKVPSSNARRSALRPLMAGTLLALPCAGTLLASQAARAADVDAGKWPERPVRIVVPFAAGGTTDLSARIIAEALTRSLGQTFVVDNRAGAGGNIGAAEVAKAKPDGYTFMMGTPGTQAINQYIYSKMPYRTKEDFDPVSFVVRVPNVLVVNPSVPAKTARELIDYIRANPGKLTYGSSGNGTTIHLAAEMLKAEARLDIPHVPYKGSGPMLQDLLANQVQLATDNLPSAIPFIRSGKLRALAVTSKDTAPGLADVPPLAQTVPGYEAESWFVLMAPKGTPKAIVDKLAAASDAFLKSADGIKRLNELGAVPVGGTPESLGKFIAAEDVKWKKAVEFSGARVD